MRTLKNLATLALAFCASCAMQQSSRIDENRVSSTAPQEIAVSDDWYFYQEHSVSDTILRIKLLGYSMCMDEWTEQIQRTRVVTVGPSDTKCSRQQKSDRQWAYFFGVPVMGAGIFFAAYSDDDNDGNVDHPVLGRTLIAFGSILLAGAVGGSIYCAQDPRVTETDLDIQEREEYGGEYRCKWKSLAGTNVGIMLASGTALRANTDKHGIVHFDLAGAEPEDIKQIKLYVSEYKIIEQIELSGKEQELLTFALLPKQNSRLAPVYRELKLKTRQAAIACYDQQFADNPVGGTITVSVEVAPKGRVRRLSADFDPGSLSAANACLWKAVAGLRFDPWKGEALAVRVPVSFKAPPPTAEEERDDQAYWERAVHKAPAPAPPPPEPKKKIETVLVGGTPVVFVNDPSLGCTAGVAACQTAVDQAGGCRLIRRETRRAIGGYWGIVAGAATGAMCEQKIQEICAKAVCGE